MMESRNIKLKTLLVILLGMYCVSVFAYVKKCYEDKNVLFEVHYNLEDNKILLDKFVNLSGKAVKLSDNKKEGVGVPREEVKPKNTLSFNNQECDFDIFAQDNDSRKKIFEIEKIKKSHGIGNGTSDQTTQTATTTSKEVAQTTNPSLPVEQKIDVKEETAGVSVNKKVDADEVIRTFKNYIDTTQYYSDSYYSSLKSEVEAYVGALKHIDDGDDRKNYINDNRLNGYVSDARERLEIQKRGKEKFKEDFLNRFYPKNDISDRQDCLDEMDQLLSDKLQERQKEIDKLASAIDDKSISIFGTYFNIKSILVNLVFVLILAVVAYFVYFKVKLKKNAKAPTIIPVDTEQLAAQSEIVVRRKTTSALRKQNLDDVTDNPLYLAIDSSEFCDDSSVRKIYLKNTCIKDIYNMYADDLKNPNNPNEDGCMVIGRWVHDDKTDTYNVSLEEIVKPGDDAVFAEYELNFGGKIKLKVAERLRKLRREADLQYDMTCWVHSHPGLGVFFSNADSSVQMQLKHPSHPRFLTAIVIDILTPEQEMGIFTFKHDMSINSKPELKKMYSLEDLYKWAVASERNSFKAEDYFNIMHKSQNILESCHDIFLSNGAIIDMCQLAIEQKSGLVGWTHGFRRETKGGNSFIVNSVSMEEKISDNETVGCFLVGTYRSIPTIRKEIASAGNIQFVLFYSISDGMLTAIPMADKQLVEEEKSYAEEKLEELKIWTRRKR